MIKGNWTVLDERASAEQREALIAIASGQAGGSMAALGPLIGTYNVGHPAATRLALAKASRSHMHGFGINWDDTAGGNNGHFAPFSWSAS